MSNQLPIPQSFTWSDVVSDQVQEIVTTYNAESLDALNKEPKKSVAWSSIGTKVTVGTGIVKAPVRLPSSLFFVDFDEKRDGNSLDVFTPIVRVSPKMLNFYWPMIWGQDGGRGIGTYAPDGTVQEFMGASGIASGIIAAARAHKAYLAATLLYTGFTSSSLGVTATRLTYPQPGHPNGLPLFTNGVDSDPHYAHPFSSASDTFVNLYEGVGNFDTYFAQALIDMYQVPHPCMPNLTLENEVTDVVVPTFMQDVVWRTAIQTLALQAQTNPFNAAAATTNAYSAETLAKASSASFIGASGLAPWRFWTSSLLNKHPYYTANDGEHMTDGPGGGPSHMWVTISAMPGDTQTWCEFAGPSKDFTPRIHLFGDGDPTSIAQRRVRMLGDLDAGVGAGLPHPVKMYFAKS